MKSKNILIYIYTILKLYDSDLHSISLHLLFPSIIFFAIPRILDSQ